MKNASPALIAFINQIRGNPDASFAIADCFTFALHDGTVLTLTNADTPISYNGVLFRADGPLVQGLKYHSSVGLSVDTQQLVLAARSSDLVAGAPILANLRSGGFDGALVQRDRVFMSAPGQTPIGGLTLFKGRVATIDSVGRLRAIMTVASDLVVLDNDMPRNIYGATCQHSLFDAGCGLNASAFANTGAADSGSTAQWINWSGASSAHIQGSIIITSGMNANRRSTIARINNGSALGLIIPLPNPVAAGDTFTVYYGCDHTQASCQAKFNNQARFRGFPFVPPPTMAQ